MPNVLTKIGTGRENCNLLKSKQSNYNFVSLVHSDQTGSQVCPISFQSKGQKIPDSDFHHGRQKSLQRRDKFRGEILS